MTSSGVINLNGTSKSSTDGLFHQSGEDLLLIELNDLNGVCGRRVMQRAPPILEGALDRNDVGGLIDGVGGLRTVGLQHYEFPRIRKGPSREFQVHGLLNRGGIDQFEVKLSLFRVVGDGIE